MEKKGTETLIRKVESFARKYYLNRLLHGILLGAIMWFLLLFALNTLEYFSWLTQRGRFVLFVCLVLGSLCIAVRYFIIPIYNLIRYRKAMPKEKAALMIGRFFPDIQDKLLNTLQLGDELESSDNQLLSAAVEQRTASLSPFNFTDAVSLKDNVKFAVTFALLFVVAVLLSVFVPRYAVQPTQRIINYNQHYEKPLPYTIDISDTEIEVTKGENATFSIIVKGERVPENFFVKGVFGQQLMTKTAANVFSYTFRNVSNNIDFTIVGGDYHSPSLSIKVHSKPVLLSYTANIEYPAYTGYKAETIEGRNHLVVPIGTRIRFTFLLRDADSCFIINDTLTTLCNITNSKSIYDIKACNPEKIAVLLSNKWGGVSDKMFFSIDVIDDAYPEIKVEQFSEQLSYDIYYSGLLTDDYGFTKLTFNYSDIGGGETKINLSFDKSSTRSSFYFNVNTDTLDIAENKPIEAYFEIWDNDFYNGPKSRRSEVFVFNPPTAHSFDTAAMVMQNDIMNKMSAKANEAASLRDEMDKMLRDLLTKQELDWMDKEKLKNLVEKQNKLQQEWNELQNEQRNLADFMRDKNISNEALRQKREQINKLFEDTMSEEMKKVMAEIEKMLEQLPRNRIQEMLRNMQSDNKQLNDLLDRNLALLEQLKVEKDIYDLINKLEQLADKLQNDSLNQTDAGQASDDFDKLMDELSDLEQRNQELTQPFGISKDEQMENSINDQLDKASSEQQQGNEKQSQQHKSNAAQQMQQMAQGLSMQMQMSGMEQMAEDAELVRQMLENTVLASHRQENLMIETGNMLKDDPRLRLILTEQSELLLNFGMVRDSLKAMAMRQPAIQNFVFDELNNIETQSNLALRNMNELKLSTAAASQQRSLMAMNNLALMLAESLENIQSSMMSQGMPMMGNNPKQSGQQSQNMKGMSQQQQGLGKKLKELQQQMQKQGGQNQSSMSEQLVRMAAEQEMLRQGMQKMLDEMKQNGQLGDGGMQKIIEEMKKLEEEIVNKKITNNTIQRNQDIISRMLESEKALQEQEKDEKRKSNEFKGTLKPRSIGDVNYKNSAKNNTDYLRLRPVEYQPYYKEKINNYYLRKNSNRQ